MFIAVSWRGWKSRTSWARTTASIKTFGISYGVPSVIYEYEVDGRKLTGNCIVPGAFAGGLRGTTPSKSVYLHADGSLKFPPNAEVDVFYDPKHPSDAALVTGIPAGIWKGFALILLLLGIAVSIYRYREWAGNHAGNLVLAGFGCCGFFLFGWSLKWLKDYARSRGFPSTSGHLLKAEIVYLNGGVGAGGSSGFVPAVEFEYEVNGSLYRSSQLTSVFFQTLHYRPKDVQPMIDRLRAEPNITVYFDPQAPWVGFLQHGSVWSALIPVFMGLLSTSVFLAIWLFLIRR